MNIAEFLGNGPGLLLLSAAVPGLFFLVAFAIYQSRRQAMRQRRIQRVQQSPSAETSATKAILSVKRVTRDSGIVAIDALIKRIVPNPENLRARLERTGFNITLGVYFMASVLVCLVVVLIGRIYPVLPFPAVVLFGIFGAFALPQFAISFLAKRRLQQFLESFPESIDLIVRGLRSGLPVTESVKTVSAELGGPVAVEFSKVSDNIKFGKTISEALDACAA